MNLNMKDRLVVLAVANGHTGATVNTLAKVTALPWDEIQSCICTLVAHGLIAMTTEDDTEYYATPALGSEPIIRAWKSWLQEFWESRPPIVDGDTLGTTYASCGAVILAALLAGTRDVGIIAPLSTLPLTFVGLVLQVTDVHKIWYSEPVYELERLLHQPEIDLCEVESLMNEVMELTWERCWTPEIGDSLECSREGLQVLGGADQWID